MSVISTVANYGGKISDYQQNIKQFNISNQSIVYWIYKNISNTNIDTLSNNLTVITPSDSKKPVLINNDLIVSGAIYNTSDERLKENITPIDTKYSSNLLNLNPVKYLFKNEKNKKTHFGFLAQDIEKIFPELVEENFFGYKTINYQELIPLMLLKMKNMQLEIDNLKELIK
jgi:hypothetical protein